MIEEKKSKMARIAEAYGNEEKLLSETFDAIKATWNDEAGKVTARRTQDLIDDMKACRKRMTQWFG